MSSVGLYEGDVRPLLPLLDDEADLGFLNLIAFLESGAVAIRILG